ncbi:MAG: hypothetical protein U1E10_03385, partial [Bdellovibrionales bacterium]|nr:hypothetical protein [Bdellovibrionales bacterium]
IRFQSEEEGGFRRTLYPEAVKNVVQRTDELKALAAQSHLGALFPYLELTDLVKGRQAQSGLPATAPFLNFLNQAAELIVAQSPPELQLPLRRMYFAGESIEVSDSVWRNSNGSRHVRGDLLSGNAISVEIVSGLENSPGLQKLHRLIAMIEIGQAHTAREMNRGADYRLYFPVLDMLNKIVTSLFVDETLKKMGTEVIRQELAKVEGPETVKASLDFDFLGRGYMHSKSMSWAIENPELRGPQLVEWVRDLRVMRDQKAKSIKGLSSYNEKVEALVRQDLLNQSRDKYFQLAREARSSGDEKSFRILSELMVRRGAGPAPVEPGPSGPGPSCETSFKIQ